MSLDIPDIDDLRCCGNCKYFDITEISNFRFQIKCNFDFEIEPMPHNKCDKWEFDNIKWQDRIISCGTDAAHNQARNGI